MSEPRLQDMGDYNTLSGEKRRIVWAVVIAGIIIGTVYGIARACFVPDDVLTPTEKVGKIPFK